MIKYFGILWFLCGCPLELVGSERRSVKARVGAPEYPSGRMAVEKDEREVKAAELVGISGCVPIKLGDQSPHLMGPLRNYFPQPLALIVADYVGHQEEQIPYCGANDMGYQKYLDWGLFSPCNHLHFFTIRENLPVIREYRAYKTRVRDRSGANHGDGALAVRGRAHQAPMQSEMRIGRVIRQNFGERRPGRLRLDNDLDIRAYQEAELSGLSLEVGAMDMLNALLKRSQLLALPRNDPRVAFLESHTLLYAGPGVRVRHVVQAMSNFLIILRHVRKQLPGERFAKISYGRDIDLNALADSYDRHRAALEAISADEHELLVPVFFSGDCVTLDECMSARAQMLADGSWFHDEPVG